MQDIKDVREFAVWSDGGDGRVIFENARTAKEAATAILQRNSFQDAAKIFVIDARRATSFVRSVTAVKGDES